MGPRSSERGMLTPAFGLTDTAVLQWGRALLSAEWALLGTIRAESFSFNGAALF